MFKKLFDKMMAAETPKEVEEIMLTDVTMAFQHEKIGWNDHERLFTLGARLIKLAELLNA